MMVGYCEFYGITKGSRVSRCVFITICPENNTEDSTVMYCFINIFVTTLFSRSQTLQLYRDDSVSISSTSLQYRVGGAQKVEQNMSLLYNYILSHGLGYKSLHSGYVLNNFLIR